MRKEGASLVVLVNMDKDIKARWVEALLSGEYVQGRDRLKEMRNGVTRYCCLGVLAEVTGFKSSNDEILIDPITGSGHVFGLKKHNQCNLVIMNDKGVPFPEIAEYIEKNF